MSLSSQEFERLQGLINEKQNPDLSGFGGYSITGNIADAFKSGVEQAKSGYQSSLQGVQKAETGNFAKGTYNAISGATKMLAGGIGAAFSPLAPIGKVIEPLTNYATENISDIGAVQRFAQSKTGNVTSRLAEDINNLSTITGAVAGSKTLAGAAPKVLGGTRNAVNSIIKGGGGAGAKIVDTIDNIGRKIKDPEVSAATKVSLNPKKALKGTSQDVMVTVGGKPKKLSDITLTENSRMQTSTTKSLKKFTKEAEIFKNNRNPLNDPTEIVGQRVDNALEFANKKRKVVGQKMGEIETRYTNEPLPIGNKTMGTFAETLKSIDNPKYGVDTANAPIVKKLVSDFDNLEQSGATIGERLDFIRSWDKYLNDAKDGFGNFKENATVNTRIQTAVKVLKDETVGHIAIKNKVYRGLREQYRMYKQLDEIGDRLLGKDGALGDRVKGGATIKRALKSNSDAGARQFLIKLKEITGYDAIKDGDIALTAMENVGDFQGLSLLEVLREGKTGIINRALEYAQKKVVGDNATRVNKYVQE